MKKIININLSGRVIPIEDSAYEQLQAYIESLRRYFANEEGRDEIINDIESRLAELMDEKIRKGADSITDADVQEMIANMGTTADFEAQEAEEHATVSSSAGTNSGSNAGAGSSSSTGSERRRGRLYRDSTDKMLGGVCAGLANYLNLDPAIVRILFAILGFGGFGILIYILMWIFLPPADLEGFGGKRLYRNPEDKIIGGVAGGLAAYFNRSASTIRIVFAAPLLLNILFSMLSWPFFHTGAVVPGIVFGSLTSTFIFAYIVLWIVLPEANSQYQKMEMRGEKVDLNSIRQNVREGMGNVKDRLKGWSEEVKDSAQRLSSRSREFAGTRGRDFGREAGDAVRTTGRGLGHAIGVLFKALFLFIAGVIAFSLFVALVGLLIGGIGVWPVTNFILDGFWQTTFAWGTLILFLGVPLIGFIVWLLRRIMKVRSRNNYLGWTFGGLWAIGWVSMILFVASLVNDFRMTYEERGTELAMVQPANSKMIVQVSEPEVEYSGSMPWVDIDGGGFDITRDTLRLSDVRIKVQPSEKGDANYHVEVRRYSRGRTRGEAQDKAMQILFSATFKDSLLDISSGFALAREAKYRGQHVTVLISVPVGKQIRFDETIDKLSPMTVHMSSKYEKKKWKKNYDFDFDEQFEYRTDVDYTMGEDGYLKDPSGKGVKENNNNNTTSGTDTYKYNNDNDSIKRANEQKALQEQLDREKKLKEENDRRIKELEDKLKAGENKPNTKIIVPKGNMEQSLAGAPAAGFSLVQYF